MIKYIEKQIGNHKMFLLSSGGGICKTLREMRKNKEREPELLYLLKKEIDSGMFCMDLGANIGYVSLLMADLVGKSGRISAIEPDETNFELLLKNISVNNFEDIIKPEKLLISNKNGFENFYTAKNELNLGSIMRHSKTSDRPIKIRSQTLSKRFETGKIPDLIKFDVEGAEVLILDGFYDLLSRNTNTPLKIIMELHPQFYSEKNSLEVQLKKYFEIGFAPKYVVSAAIPQPEIFKKFGYSPIMIFKSNRGLYDNISIDHTIEFCCFSHKQWMEKKKKYSEKVARFLMIERK